MDLQSSFETLIKTRKFEALKSASAVNWELSTAGGKVFWHLRAEYEGWKLQQNKFTGLYRVLDHNDCRIAWGNDLDRVIMNIAEDCMIDKRF